MLINPTLKDDVYYLKMNDININPNNFVKNGSLIFKIIRVLDFNIDARERSRKLIEINDYVRNIEQDFSTILNIPVKILYYDIVIPPKNK